MAVLGNIWDGRARHSLRAGCHSGQEAVRAGLGKSECVLVHNNGAHGVTRPTFANGWLSQSPSQQTSNVN